MASSSGVSFMAPSLFILLHFFRDLRLQTSRLNAYDITMKVGFQDWVWARAGVNSGDLALAAF